VCGIIGYVGFRQAQNLLIDCLKKLDYRGYDSAGVAIIDTTLSVAKDVGEISFLEKHLPLMKGTIGIGHTRWATHGNVTKENAHPHLSCDGTIALVHNGIIENYKQLRDELKKKGHIFTSQTDSEVIVHLIEDAYNDTLEAAVLQAIQKIKGSYAFVVICEKEPGKLVGARKESPLVIGVGDNENFLASDIPAILNYTNRVMYIDDDEICILTKNSIHVVNNNNETIQKTPEVIRWNVKDAEKAGFPHFMLKEIYEQPDAIHETLRGRISEIDNTILFPVKVADLLKRPIDSIHIIACGTSYYAGLTGKYFIEKLTNIPVFVEISSEYRYYGTRNKHSLVIAITQSGETADSLGAIRQATQAGCHTLVITNVIGSTATRISNGYILTQSGPEIGVAATKTFTAQILTLYLIALYLSSIRGTTGSHELHTLLVQLKQLSTHVKTVLERNDDVINIAKKIAGAQSVFFIGRGVNYPLSLEGALKLKEISYIHAEGFAAGELKHGPFALLTEQTPVVAIITKDDTYEKLLANIGEVKARGPMVIAVADEQDTEIEKYVDYTFRIPSTSHVLSCIPITVFLQLLAYHVADYRKCSIDKPRNLAKSVTVE
jgi:glucosamine--fructose-6-phosphate aminotransferase (isomerizing)